MACLLPAVLSGQRPATAPTTKTPVSQPQISQPPITHPTISQPTEKLSFRASDPQNPQAFEHFYNMDYDRSTQEFTLKLYDSWAATE